jgi:hypothetical protein
MTTKRERALATLSPLPAHWKPHPYAATDALGTRICNTVPAIMPIAPRWEPLLVASRAVAALRSELYQIADTHRLAAIWGALDDAVVALDDAARTLRPHQPQSK